MPITSTSTAADCTKLREAIDIIAEAMGINPASITTELIDSTAYLESE